MRSVLLAAALALGLGFGIASTSGAEAATLGGNVAAIGEVAKTGTPVAEKAYYRYRHRYWRRHYYWHPRRHGWCYYHPYRCRYRHW